MISVINDITTVFFATITTIGVIIIRLVSFVTNSKSGFALLQLLIKISRIRIKMFASANLRTN